MPRLWLWKKTVIYRYGRDILHVQDIGRADSAIDRMNLSVHYCLFQCPVQRERKKTKHGREVKEKIRKRCKPVTGNTTCRSH